MLLEKSDYENALFRSFGPPGQPAFLTGFRSEAARTGMDTRRATEGPADGPAAKLQALTVRRGAGPSATQ
jgi:hypothetical protein